MPPAQMLLRKSSRVQMAMTFLSKVRLYLKEKLVVETKHSESWNHSGFALEIIKENT